MERKERCRLGVLGLLWLGIMGVFFALLWRYQVIEGEAWRAETQRRQTKTVTAEGRRGDILDRNGTPLVTSETVWQVTVGSCNEAQRAALVDLCGEFDLEPLAEGETVTLSDPAFLAAAAEGGVPLSSTATQRRIYHTDAAPHLLGRVGAIPAEEWEDYQEKGYDLSDRVGLDGIEGAFEESLRGWDTTLRLEYDENGQITGKTVLTGGGAGEDVTLTLDLDLQLAAEQALETGIAGMESAAGGALVVVNVNDGSIVAAASWPDFSLETFSADYAALSAAQLSPYLNRAFQGTYPPGSVFKLVTAAAGLEEGAIEPDSRIYDTGIYTHYADYQPQCWLYRQNGRSHGWETVSGALRDSCNVFFYEVGQRLGASTLEKWGQTFGLGQKTGVELPEAAGVLAGPENSAKKGESWYGGNTLAAAIGQSDHLCTPLQLAGLTAAIANGGTRYALHLTKSVGEEEYEPSILGTISLSEENRAAIIKGMEQVVTQGSLRTVFSDLPVTAGAKTGSAQVAGQEKANGVLVCFGPLEEPEIAVCIVVEEAGGGSALAGIAAAVMEAYFGEHEEIDN